MEDRMTSSRGLLAVLLRTMREGAGLTQRELASRAGISLGALQDLEQGRTSRPRRQSLDRLAAVLRLTADQHEELVRAAVGHRTAGHKAAGHGDAGQQGTRQQGTGHKSGEPERDGAGTWPVGAQNGQGATAPERPRTGQRGGVTGTGHGRNGNSGLRVEILGPLAAWRDGEPVSLGPVRQRAVLGLLTLHADTGLHRAAIVDALWGDDPPPTSAAMVQAQVSRLRRLLGPGQVPGDGTRLSWDGAGYRLSLNGIRLDLAEFGELTGQARRVAGAGDTATACELYERALGLWRGQPLEDIDALRGHPAVTSLARQRDDLVIEYAVAAADAGRYDGVIAHLAALTAREPLDERAHAQLIMTLAATGRQAAALRIYQDLVARLDAELGVRPGPELATAHLQVLRQQVPPVPADGPVVPRQLPGAVPRFIGRSAELALLTGMLDQAAGAGGTVAIGGTAGVGKTTLAVHWAHQVADRFPDGQLHINLRGFGPSGPPVTAAAAVRLFLDGLGVAAERIPPGLDAQTGLYRSLLAGRKMLIVVDNARDPEQVRPLLPGAPGCLVLVTSRNELTGLAAADGAHLLTLDVLSEAEARELLENRLGQQRVADEPGAVTDLIGLCARLPLALSVAAARVAARPSLPLGAVAAELRGTSTRLDGLNTGDAATDVRTVFSWSCRQLAEPSARLFRLIGVHPGPGITIRAAASLAGLPSSQARAALAELAGAHLITEYAPGRYACHDLLRAYAAEQARSVDSDSIRRAALHRLLDHYLHTCHSAAQLLQPQRGALTLAPAQPGVTTEHLTDHEQALAWFKAEHHVLVAVAGLAAEHGFDTCAWQLSWSMATFLDWQGHWQDWAATQRIALAAVTRQDDMGAQATVRRAVAAACIRFGDYDEARTHLTECLGIYAQLGDRAGESRIRRDLGNLFEYQGRYAEALDHAEQALRLSQAIADRAGQAYALTNVGWYHTMLGQHQQALKCCQRALRLHRELGARYGEAHTWISLGHVNYKLGSLGKAAACHRHGLSLFRELGDRLYEATALTYLGDAHSAAGRTTAARRAWQQALAILDELNHSDADGVRSRLGQHPAGRGGHLAVVPD
jgi:DNA-binding SARP family transcriptional activator